jgi:hypothetical protein
VKFSLIIYKKRSIVMDNNNIKIENLKIFYNVLAKKKKDLEFQEFLLTQIKEKSHRKEIKCEIELLKRRIMRIEKDNKVYRLRQLFDNIK